MFHVNNELSSLLDCSKENIAEFLFSFRMGKCEDYGLTSLLAQGRPQPVPM